MNQVQLQQDRVKPINPKQQINTLLAEASNILVVTAKNPNNDQIAGVSAFESVMRKVGKTSLVVVTDPLPKIAEVINTENIATSPESSRELVISLELGDKNLQRLHYKLDDGRLLISVMPDKGQIDPKSIEYHYGTFNFDLVVALGVSDFSRIDRLQEKYPTIFDGYHLINVDYHRNNTNYGSINFVDSKASSISEILVALFESMGQNLLDPEIATSLFAGIMSNTNRFCNVQTTAKSMTVAAQMLAAGADQQAVVKALFQDKKKSSKPR
ncbi:hypothetical protein KC853_00370 [Candidatus Saccharibacteria bacterium]|nr:hypothetical protein [Candidatus Saccharibacteria bacterium]MCB9834553.1 hypothetical protein [Candidatus Nomurabacteria bacterium]